MDLNSFARLFLQDQVAHAKQACRTASYPVSCNRWGEIVEEMKLRDALPESNRTRSTHFVSPSSHFALAGEHRTVRTIHSETTTLHCRNAIVSGLREPRMTNSASGDPPRYAKFARCPLTGSMLTDVLAPGVLGVLGVDLAYDIPSTIQPNQHPHRRTHGCAWNRGHWCRA